MRKTKFIRTAHWPKRKERKFKTDYQSNIPPRDWKYWLAVAFSVGLMAGLVCFLLKAA
ncbi:MAG TPA: hypothetical protein VMV05_09370 [bacterium]|nr:hypothetical protein [bacterium]